MSSWGDWSVEPFSVEETWKLHCGKSSYDGYSSPFSYDNYLRGGVSDVCTFGGRVQDEGHERQ